MNIIPYLIIFFGSINLIRMGLFIIGSDYYELREFLHKKRQKKISPLPVISIFIPTHNEEGTIVRAVDSIVHNNYPLHKLRIVVIDDGSTDNTRKNLIQYKKYNNIRNLMYVFQKNQGKARALNSGIKKYAKGTLMMCLDGDSYLAPNALSNAVRYFSDKRVMALASNVKIRPTGQFLNLVQQFEYLICYQMKRAQSFFNIEYIIGGIGSVFRRKFIEQIGCYDGDTITEDIDLTMKILQHGNKNYRVIYGSDVVAYTESVLSIKDLLKQRFRWKWGRSQTFYKNRNLFFNSNTIFTKALTFFYLPYAIFCDIAFFFEPFMIGYIFYIVIHYGDIITLISALFVISIYLVINVFMETTLTLRQKLQLIPLVPSMYFFFYILSFVEYFALIKMMITLPSLKSSLKKNMCNWTHVTRYQTTVSV